MNGKRTYRNAFTLIGMGIGFGLWYRYDSFWMFLASMFVLMGVGTIVDIKLQKSE